MWCLMFSKMATISTAASREKGEAKISSHGLNTDFCIGETALCYEPDQTKAKMLYEAKILEIDVTKDEKGKKVPEFFIHFIGWNKSWDRWVLQDSVLKVSETNKALQNKLYNQAVRSKKKRKSKFEKKEQAEDGSFDSNSHTSQSSFNSSQAETEDSRDLPLVTINIPHVLKTRLEDDCYYIKRNKKLLKLPRVPSALKILNDFWDYCCESATSQNDAGNPKQNDINLYVIKELVGGLQTYLNFTLSTLLLYSFEREQFEALFPPKYPNPLSGQAKTPANKTQTDCLINSEKPVAASERSNTPTRVKRKYTRRQFPAQVDRAKKIGKEKPPCKAMAIPSPAVAVPGQEPAPAPRKRGRPRRKRPVEPEASTEKQNVVAKEVKLENAEPAKPPVQGTDGQASMDKAAEIVKVEDGSSQLTNSEQKQVDIEAESVNTEMEQREGDSDNKARTLRPRRSIIPMKHSKVVEKEATSEQASLPMGATAETIDALESSEQNAEAVSEGEKKETRGSYFIPYPRSADKALSPAEIYGAEHLLRLFVKLPALLSRADLEQRKLDMLVEHLDKFLRFMAERAHIWFSADNYSESIL